MATIRVDVDYTIFDGSEVVFRSPVDCSTITGLKVCYVGSDGITTSKLFAFADAHGNNVGDIDHLFAENVVVKVILDVTTAMAFVQNADTNAYLESKFEALETGKAAKSHGNHVPATQTANNATFLRNDNTWQTVTPANIGAAASSHNHAASNITSGTLGVARGGTGKATHTSNAVLTGNGTSAVNNVATASGALFATAANGAAKFGTLPLAQGGTGMTSASSTSLSNGAFYYHLAKFGNLVVCTLLPKAKRSTPLYDTSVTIPSGYRPKANLTFTIFSTVNVNAGSDGYANINVNTNGVFKFNTSYGISIEEAAGTYCWVSA